LCRGEATKYGLAGKQSGTAGTIDQAQLPKFYVRCALYHGIDCSAYFDAVLKQLEHAWPQAWISYVLAQGDANTRLPVQAAAADTDTGRRNSGTKLTAGFVPGGD
jgi:hypothetical protein